MSSTSQLGSLTRSDLASAWQRVLFIAVNRFEARLEREFDLPRQRENLAATAPDQHLRAGETKRVLEMDGFVVTPEGSLLNSSAA